jgi:hypothetical protein
MSPFVFLGESRKVAFVSHDADLLLVEESELKAKA